MIWKGDECKHQGTLARGRVVTKCGLSLPAGEALRVSLAPGDSPPDDEICHLSCIAALGAVIRGLRPGQLAVLLGWLWLTAGGVLVLVWLVWSR